MLHLCDLDLDQYAVKYMDATDRAEEGWEVVQMAVNRKTVFMRACIGACTVAPEQRHVTPVQILSPSHMELLAWVCIFYKHSLESSPCRIETNTLAEVWQTYYPFVKLKGRHFSFNPTERTAIYHAGRHVTGCMIREQSLPNQTAVVQYRQVTAVSKDTQPADKPKVEST